MIEILSILKWRTFQLLKMTQKELIRWNCLDIIFIKFVHQWILCTSNIILTYVRGKSVKLAFKIG